MTMYISIDLSDSKPTYLQIVEAIRRAVATGALKPGDRLPPIREVAVQARVNRNTVARAYLELEHQGVIRSRQGAGSFISEEGPNLEQTERRRLLRKKAEELALEAFHFRVPIEEVIEMLREKETEFHTESTGNTENTQESPL